MCRRDYFPHCVDHPRSVGGENANDARQKATASRPKPSKSLSSRFRRGRTLRRRSDADRRGALRSRSVEAARLAAERASDFPLRHLHARRRIIGFEGWACSCASLRTLKSVSGITNGQYFYAGNAADLKKVYRTLNSRFVLEKKETEVTALFSAIAALFAVTSALLSLLWFNRIL